MAGTRKKPPAESPGVVGRLTEKGEEATGRLLEAFGKNTRVTDALARAMSAKGKLDAAGHAALGSVGIAASDDVKELRKKLERLERRLTKLEGGTPSRTARRSATKKTPTAKRRTRTAASKAETEKAASPAPGRAIGGGAARSGKAGGGTP